MDLANLINQLESIIESGRKVPVANKTLVDTEQILSVIGQLRASIPKDIQEAKEMLGNAKKAQQEIESFLSKARKDIEHERTAAVEEVRSHFAELAVSAAEKIISRSLDKKTHEKLISDVLDDATKINGE